MITKKYIPLIILIITGACSFRQPVRTPFPNATKVNAPVNWEEIHQKKSKIDEFKILNTGSVKVPLSGMLNTKKLPENHPFEKSLWVDVFAFLFHHQEKGWYLIDTGMDSSFQLNGNISGLLAGQYIEETMQTPGQNIGDQLAKENKVIRGIFFTHLHADHSSGMPEIPASIPKFIGKGDHYLNVPLLYSNNHFSKSDTLIELDWNKGYSLYPFTSVTDIFGDQSLFAVHTPGHSSGHLSYLLFTIDGPVLLTGDASHTQYGFNNGIEPGWVDDRELAEKSLDQLRKYAQMFPGTRIIYGHQIQ